MATLVCFHAHPDDEAISTGGTMVRASQQGHRVVLVCATRGEQGEPQAGVLAEGEALWERRWQELTESCRILGAEPPRWLGYEDSGMMGEPTNDNPRCFWEASVEEAAARFAQILLEVEADVVTVYDDHGNYGHPDHIQVYRVGLRGAELAGRDTVYEATANRTRMRRLFEEAAEMNVVGEPVDPDGARPNLDVETFGTEENNISYRVDVADLAPRKREAMTAHRSQIGPDSFFLLMDDEAFGQAFGSEWFNIPGRVDTGGPTTVGLLPGLE